MEASTSWSRSTRSGRSRTPKLGAVRVCLPHPPCSLHTPPLPVDCHPVVSHTLSLTLSFQVLEAARAVRVARVAKPFGGARASGAARVPREAEVARRTGTPAQDPQQRAGAKAARVRLVARESAGAERMRGAMSSPRWPPLSGGPGRRHGRLARGFMCHLGGAVMGATTTRAVALGVGRTGVPSFS